MLDDGIPIGLRISFDLRQMCLELFQDLDEFKYPEKLISFVRSYELTIVLRRMPREKELELDTLIDRLMDWGKSAKEPALLELIVALERKYQNEYQAEACKKLRKSMENWLVTASRFDQVHDYEALIAESSKQPQRVTKSAEQWIDDCGDDLDELALRITICVFNGTTFETIEKAKNKLLALLQELEKPATSIAPVTTPSLSVMRRLARAGAEESEARPPDWRKVIQLTKPAMAIEALHYVWRMNREIEWRDRFIRWLSEHAVEDHPAAVRMRAAVAAGRLAIKDYGYVRDHVFNRWVKENTRTSRMALGMALGIAVRDEPLGPEIQQQLRIWSHSKREEERWAALRAYIFVGAYCQPTSEVLESWRYIANSEPSTVSIELAGYSFIGPNPLHMSLVDAIMRFFVLVADLPAKKRESILTGIVEGLNRWINEKKPDAELGLFIFLMLARLVGSSDDDNGSVSGFLLLQLIDPKAKQSAFRQQLTQFFSNAFRSASTIRHTNQVLCEWLKWINKLPAESDTYDLRIQTLLTDLVASDPSGRMQGKLLSFLRSCGGKGSVERAAAVLKTS